jgi:hypothetical protein
VATAAGFLRFCAAPQGCRIACRKACRAASFAIEDPTRSAARTTLPEAEPKTGRDDSPANRRTPMANPSHKLTDAQKVQIVKRLAAYDPPEVILRWLQEEYGLTVDRTAILYYNPERYAGRRCPERWKTLFHEMRKTIVAGWAEIGAAHKMVRVRWLDAMVHDAMYSGDYRLAMKCLAQVRREMDPRYATNKQEDGEPPVHISTRWR